MKLFKNLFKRKIKPASSIRGYSSGGGADLLDISSPLNPLSPFSIYNQDSGYSHNSTPDFDFGGGSSGGGGASGDWDSGSSSFDSGSSSFDSGSSSSFD